MRLTEQRPSLRPHLRLHLRAAGFTWGRRASWRADNKRPHLERPTTQRSREREPISAGPPNCLPCQMVSRLYGRLAGWPLGPAQVATSRWLASTHPAGRPVEFMCARLSGLRQWPARSDSNRASGREKRRPGRRAPVPLHFGNPSPIGTNNNNGSMGGSCWSSGSRTGALGELRKSVSYRRHHLIPAGFARLAPERRATGSVLATSEPGSIMMLLPFCVAER